MIASFLSSFVQDESGSPAAEFVLSLPMILPLIFIAMEAGNFFWSQQKLTQAVRDGSRFAARQSYADVCPSLDTALEGQIKNLTRTGYISGGYSKIPNWTNSQVSVVVHCGQFASTGIYDGLAGAGAIVTVSANGVPYRSILGLLGVINDSYFLAADANAPVIGI